MEEERIKTNKQKKQKQAMNKMIFNNISVIYKRIHKQNECTVFNNENILIYK